MYNMAHPSHMLPECVEVHTILAENSKFQCKTLEEIKVELRSINEKLETQSNRIWLLYTKIVIIACLSGGGVAGILKFVI